MEPIKLGKYQLMKKIAAGGMAEIFVAKVTGLPGFEKIVVVKRILPQLASNQEFIQMFLDEARIAATLHHPNIVQMYDIGAVDGNYFISMEYLHGEDVRSLMKGLRQANLGLPIEHALGVVMGLAAGLHYAHEKAGFDGKPLGIVHRDVTPQNVFITYDGSVKIVDFGIAKASNRFNETKYGTLKGKIPYMSPEQCRSEPLDRRSDVFAIGIMLYELTTGYRLYKGSSEFEILKKIVEGTIAPPSTLRPGYPKALEAIVMKALAKKKDERYQTAQELQADVEAFAREHRLGVSPITLAAFMHKVFGKKIEAWQEAQAAGGADLEAHLAERHKAPSSPGPGDSLASGVREIAEEDLEEVSEDQVAQATPSTHGELRPAAPAVPVPAAVSPPGSRKKGLLAVAAATVIAVGAVLVAVKLRGGESPTVAQAAVTGSPADPPAPALPPTPAAAPDAGPAVAPPPVVAPQAAGLIKVATRPGGATVFVDGQPWRERTPTVVDGLAPGRHEVKVELKGHAAEVKEVEVTAGGTASLEVKLQKADDARADKRDPKRDPGAKPDPGTKPDPDPQPPPATGDGELTIASTPSCTVMINGKLVGSTTIYKKKLPAGTYQVQLINSRYNIDKTYTVEVRAGEHTKFKRDFPVTPN